MRGDWGTLSRVVISSSAEKIFLQRASAILEDVFFLVWTHTFSLLILSEDFPHCAAVAPRTHAFKLCRLKDKVLDKSSLCAVTWQLLKTLPFFFKYLFETVTEKKRERESMCAWVHAREILHMPVCSQTGAVAKAAYRGQRAWNSITFVDTLAGGRIRNGTAVKHNAHIELQCCILWFYLLCPTFGPGTVSSS